MKNNPELKSLSEEDLTIYMGKEVAKDPEIIVREAKKFLEASYFKDEYGIKVNADDITCRIIESLIPYQR